MRFPQSTLRTPMAPAALLIGSSFKPSLGSRAVPRTRVGDRASHDNLEGILSDMTSMRTFFRNHGVEIENILFNAQYTMPKRDVLSYVGKLFGKPATSYIIYFSGHGQSGSGNWCVTDKDCINLREIRDLWDAAIRQNPGQKSLLLIADCCFSGSWVDQLVNVSDIHMSASCGRNETCLDTFEGGVFTTKFVNAAHYLIDCPVALYSTSRSCPPPFNPCCTVSAGYNNIIFAGIALPKGWVHLGFNKHSLRQNGKLFYDLSQMLGQYIEHIFTVIEPFQVDPDSNATRFIAARQRQPTSLPSNYRAALSQWQQSANCCPCSYLLQVPAMADYSNMSLLPKISESDHVNLDMVKQRLNHPGTGQKLLPWSSN